MPVSVGLNDCVVDQDCVALGDSVWLAVSVEVREGVRVGVRVCVADCVAVILGVADCDATTIPLRGIGLSRLVEPQ